MATEEFYIRDASETEARGPFNLEQLVSLAEAGQVTLETLYYEATTETWAEIGSNPEVKDAVFPEKKKLRIKAKEIHSLNRPADSHAPITVDEMLAAAEGRTAETKDKRDPEVAASRAARFGMWAVVLMLLACAAGEMLPASDALMALDMSKLALQPLVFLGGADLFLAVMIALGVTTLYPFVRFRAAVGLGLFGFLFYTQGYHPQLMPVILGSAGLYLATVFLSLVPVLVSATAGLFGMGAVAYFLLSF